jgi:uncharacterized protein (TIGR02453 family)
VAQFNGFGPKALAFFKGLKFHRSKAWFEENRSLYQSDVLDPMFALLDELTARFAKARIPLKGEGKRSVFRLNRDIRFSKDKSPYKTHAGAVMTRSGDKKDHGLLYIHVDPEGCFVAAGFYMPEPPVLAKLRAAIRGDPKKAGALVAALQTSSLEFGTFDQLSRIPRGFEDFRDGPLDGMVRLKSFIVEEKVPEKSILSSKFADIVFEFAGRAKPLLDFGWKAIG